jgi:hypothetical protein
MHVVLKKIVYNAFAEGHRYNTNMMVPKHSTFSKGGGSKGKNILTQPFQMKGRLTSKQVPRSERGER